MATISLAGVWAPYSAVDACLAVVPFFHVTGMQVVMNSTLHAGGEQVVMTRWERELALKLIECHGVISWTNIPTMVIDLFASANLNATSLRSLRHIGGGGAPMPEAIVVLRMVIKRLRDQYPPAAGCAGTRIPNTLASCAPCWRSNLACRRSIGMAS